MLVFAACARVPFVAFPYGAKVTEFAQSLGMPTVPVTNAGHLLAAVDRAWDLRKGLRDTLSEKVAETTTLAACTADWAVRILESRRVPPSRAVPIRAALGQRRRHDS